MLHHEKVIFLKCIIISFRGTYEIEPRAMNCNPPLESFKIVIEIQPDATKPVEMKVKYGNKSVFGVADKLPGKCRGFQYFSSLPVLHYFHDYLIQHSIKSGSTKDHYRQVKVLGTTPY
jgi:hypothetical protein